MIVAKTFELNRRQVLAVAVVGCAVSSLSLPATASTIRPIRYRVARISMDKAASRLQVLRDDASSLSQLVLGNDDHILILSGALGGTGGLRLEI